MKKLLTTAVFCLGITCLQAQVRMPQPSSGQTIKQDFGQGTVEVTYSRPNKNGRELFGALVPYGKLWRTGANAATRLTFTEPVIINGQNIDTGSYALYTIPGKESWEVIINKGFKNSGTSGYKESEDVLRFKVVPQKLKHSLETFTIQFSNVDKTTMDMHLVWGDVMITIPFKADFKDKLRKELEDALNGDKKPHWQAAQFYYEYDQDYEKAINHVNEVLVQNEKAFWVWHYKAKIQRDMKDYAGARKSAEQSMKLALDAGNDDYVKMNKELIGSIDGK